MALTDADYLEELKTWRDNIVAALKTPETVSAYGGMPEASGSNQIGRMGGRAQLLAELEKVEAKIVEAQEAVDGPVLHETRGVPL